MTEFVDVLVLCRSPAGSAADEATLTADERARRALYHHPIDADRFLVGRSTLRREVADRLRVFDYPVDYT